MHFIFFPFKQTEPLQLVRVQLVYIYIYSDSLFFIEKAISNPLKGEGKVGDEFRLVPCSTMLVIGSLDLVWFGLVIDTKSIFIHTNSSISNNSV